MLNNIQILEYLKTISFMQATVTIFINIKLNPIWTQGVVPIARLEGFRDLKLPIGVF